MQAQVKSKKTRKQETVTVACLLPGLSDVVHDLGFSRNIVASTHECDADIRNTSVTKPKLSDTQKLSSSEIAAGWNVVASDVSNSSRRTLDMLSTCACSFYYVDIAKLAATSPTILLTDLSKQKSPVDPDEEEMKKALKRYIPGLKTIISSKHQTLNEIYELHHATAEALGDPSAAVEAVAAARARLHSIKAKFGGTAKKKVTVVQWANPLFLAGDWVPQILKVAGGAPDGVTSAGGPSLCVSPTSLLQMDVVIFSICAVKLSGSKRIMKSFWKENSALFRKWPGRFYITDATKLYSRPSVSTVVESAEVTAEILSGRNHFGHKDVLWMEWKPS